MVFNGDFSLEHCKAELWLPGGIAGFFFFFFFYPASQAQSPGGRGGWGGPWEKFRAWELLPGEKALQSLLSKIPGNIGPAHSILLHVLDVSP